MLRSEILAETWAGFPSKDPANQMVAGTHRRWILWDIGVALPGYGVIVFAVVHDDPLCFFSDVDLLDVALGHFLQRFFRPRLERLQRAEIVRNTPSKIHNSNNPSRILRKDSWKYIVGRDPYDPSKTRRNLLGHCK